MVSLYKWSVLKRRWVTYINIFKFTSSLYFLNIFCEIGPLWILQDLTYEVLSDSNPLIEPMFNNAYSTMWLQ